MLERLQRISVERYNWTNATRNVAVTPKRFFFPENEEDIRHIVERAEAEGLRVKAVGSGHSYSEVAKGQDYLLSMKKITSVDEVDASGRSATFVDKKLVSCGAGTILKKLTRELDRLGLALSNMGAVDFQTISGAMLTGTHGTGITRPAVQDMVRSLKMVGTGGEYLTVEPTVGPTDPASFSTDGNQRLIQDDDIFNSVILGFGAMGIIYEITLEVEPQFWMKEERYLMDWSELKSDLLSGEFMKKVRGKEFVAFRVNPYEIKGKHLCAVVEQQVIDLEDRPKGFGLARRNLLSSIGGNLEFMIESTIRKAVRMPISVKKTINFALKATKDVRGFFGKSYQVLYQSGNAVISYGISSEFAFPADGDKIVEVMETIFDQAERNARESGVYQSSHIPVRFVPGSKALLSSAYEQDTVYIDVPLLFGTPGDIEILEGFQRRMISIGGIPHWGKHNTQLYLQNDFIRSKFDRIDDWIKVRRDLDPKGTFLNDFVLQMGLK